MIRLLEAEDSFETHVCTMSILIASKEKRGNFTTVKVNNDFTKNKLPINRKLLEEIEMKFRFCVFGWFDSNQLTNAKHIPWHFKRYCI